MTLLRVKTIERLVGALEEARLQLEYLNEKQPRGTTTATLARIDAALTDARLSAPVVALQAEKDSA